MAYFRSDRPSGGAAPLRRAERSLNTNQLGFGGSLDDVLAALRRLGPEKMGKNGHLQGKIWLKMVKSGYFHSNDAQFGPQGHFVVSNSVLNCQPHRLAV